MRKQMAMIHSAYDVYIAAPIVGITEKQKNEIMNIAHKIMDYLYEKTGQTASVYCPWELKIPNAWNMPLDEWSRCVFTQDILALDASEWVVICDFGRNSSAGTAWEAGYAFGTSKKTLVVVMPGVQEQSLMMRNGCTRCIRAESILEGPCTIPNYRNQASETGIVLN